MQFFLTDFTVHNSMPYLCGLKESGETVAVQVVHAPWVIYIEPPLNSDSEDCTRSWFNDRLRPFLESKERVSKYFRPSLTMVHQKKLCGYSADKTWMIKAIYDTIADAKRDAYAILNRFKQCRIYHHNIDPQLLFVAHIGIRCFSWLTLSSFQVVTTSRKSICDLEVRCDARCLSMDKDEDKPAPHMRVAAFDLETDGLDWRGGDTIRMVSIVCEDREFLLTRHPLLMEPAPTYCVIDCQDEIDLIKKFVDVVNELRPIFLTGWNVFQFDLEFLFERARILGCDPYLQNLSWLHTRKLSAVMKEMSSAAYGMNKIFDDTLVGLITLDGYILARKSMKMPSYSLKSFGEWVGAPKGDVTYKEMVLAFTTKDPALLREVADYCVTDSRLVPQILERMEEPTKVIAMTRLASVPPVYTIKRGTSILTFGLIVHEAFRRSLIINPTPRVEGQEVGYKGATVIDPLRGLHSDPVAVLDFASLYPTIMQAFNICVSTHIKTFTKNEEVPTEYIFPEFSVIKIDSGETAVFKREGIEGVYPSILRVLLEHRKAVKKQMKSLEPGTVAYNQANAKQLSLKISANSLYGYCGASTSQLYERALAASVTSVGRDSLFSVRTTIQELCKEGKIPADVHVVYGDSVTGNTPLLVREQGRISIRCIEELVGEWQEHHGNKEAFVPSPPIQVWQDGGFTPIIRVIRHTTKKSIKRVMTPLGMVDTTEDHSLLMTNGSKVSPNGVNIGDGLLHHDDSLLMAELSSKYCAMDPQDAFEAGVYGAEITPEILCGSMDVVRAYWEGFGLEDCFYTKKKAAGLFLLARRMGLSYHLAPYDETSDLVSLVEGPSYGDPTAINYIGVVSSRYEGYVYDLETESHHFGVMPGKLVVHNTDSVMVKFPCMSPEQAHELSKFLEEECTKTFVPPMRLEYENLFSVYLLENKKRYAGKVWSPNIDETPTTVIKGLCVKRRDFPTIVQDGLNGILDILLGGGEGAPLKALEFIETILENLGTNQVAIEQLCITKELNRGIDAYKTPPPHLVVSRKMAERNPRDPPKSGDRITYVVLQGNGNVSEKAEDFVYARDQLGNNARFDLAYYATQLVSQCENMMVLAGMGAEFEALSKKYIMMANLFTQRQHKLSHFFATKQNDVGAEKKKPRIEEVPAVAVESGKKKQTSLNNFFTKKNEF